MDNLQYIGEDKTLKLNRREKSFKPYYKWIIFNIRENLLNSKIHKIDVLNLIING